MLQNASMSRVIGTASSNRYSRQSRKNQLPKISRTIEIRRSSHRETLNQSHLLEAADYQYLSDSSIQKEYELLRQQLLRVNETAAKQVQALQHRNMRKSFVSRSGDYRLQLLDEELKNNKAIILRLSVQNEKIAERLSYLQGLQREELEDEIEKQTKVLLRCKQENKRLNRKSQTEGKLFEISEGELDQIKKLEQERSVIEKKKRKLQKRSEEVIEGSKRVIQKLQAISHFARQADEMIEEGLESRKDLEEQERQEKKVRQREKNVQVLRSSIESICQFKEMTFKKSRDRLDQINLRISLLEDQILKGQRNLLNSKTLLVEITQQWALIKQKALMMKTEVVPLETHIPREDKDETRAHHRDTGVRTTKQRKAMQTDTKIQKEIDQKLQSGQTASIDPVKSGGKPVAVHLEKARHNTGKKVGKDTRSNISRMVQVVEKKIEMSKQLIVTSIQNKDKSRTVHKIHKVQKEQPKPNLKEHTSPNLPSQDTQPVGLLEMSLEPQEGGESMEEEIPFEQIVEEEKQKLSEPFEIRIQLADLHKSTEGIREGGEDNEAQFKISDDQSIE